MPIMTRLQNPILRSGIVVDDRGLEIEPKEIIVVEGGGDVPLPRPPILVEGGGKIPLPRPPIVGTEGGDQLVGTNGNDEMYGLGGSDTLEGGKGADKMFGGDDSDNYVVDNAGDVVVENKGEGDDDTVFSTIDYHLTDNVENLRLQGQDAINGWGNDLDNRLTGNDNTNMLFGGKGSDTLDGGKGADGMLGGEGDDFYYVDNAGDVIWELADQGTDTVYSSISYKLGLGSNLENLHLTEDGGAIDGTGNELNNNIYGNSSKNTLKGGLGDDWIDGKGGDDKMYGGEGDDSFYVDSINDVVVEYANEGNDKVFSSANTYFLSENVETLVLETGAIKGFGNDSDNNLWGNGADNELGGYGGSDHINAGAGKDILDGGTGNDFLIGNSGDDTFRFHGSFGHDLVEDFKAGGDHDIIELDHNQFADFAAVQAAMVQNIGSVTIALDGDNTIDLTGVNIADLHASDFHFI
jgi:Ca2+-binding RTX toxin-like protein